MPLGEIVFTTALPRTVATNLAMLLLLSCAPEPGNSPAAVDSAQSLQARVQAAIAAAADLPQGTLAVEVSDGVVIIRGDLSCEECGGTATPGGSGTVQQSLGAVVRAVPGVQSVEFELE